MTGDLRPYPEYKDTGLPWLGRVPAHWDVRRLRTILKQRNEKNNPVQTSQILSLSIAHGVTLYSHEGRGGNRAKSDLSAYKIARVGDLVLNSMNVVVGAVGLSRYTGAISPVYYALYPRSEDADIRYYDKLFSNTVFQRYLLIFGKGILIKEGVSGKLNTIRMKISPDDLKGIFLPVPSPDEQKAIADYLDANAVKVRRFIRNRRRLIEVLNEQKQAIINRAVTRGLDPNASLKPSGIDWLGDIPEHWEVVKLKRVARINPSRSEAFELRDSNDPVVFLPMERVSVDGQVDQSERRSVREVWQGFTYFRRGDVVVAKITPCFENGKGACLTGLDTEIGFGTTEFIVLRPSEAVSAEFLYQLTMLAEFRLLGVESMTGAAGQQRVSPDFVANFGVPVPPKHEQDRIVAYVEQKAAKFRALIDRARHEIDLIREYRTRLIADVVTGKVDVRGLAPDEPPSADEQIDEGIDDEEMLGDDEPELVEEAADADD